MMLDRILSIKKKLSFLLWFMRKYGLLPSNAMIVAIMDEVNIKNLVSYVQILIELNG
jgi:predicted nucleic acid-binding protein